jgi:hypothetical protein
MNHDIENLLKASEWTTRKKARWFLAKFPLVEDPGRRALTGLPGFPSRNAYKGWVRSLRAQGLLDWTAEDAFRLKAGQIFTIVDRKGSG